MSRMHLFYVLMLVITTFILSFSFHPQHSVLPVSDLQCAKKITAFHGSMMVLKNENNVWDNISPDLPENVKVLVASESGQSLFVGSNGGKIYEKSITGNTWTEYNLTEVFIHKEFDDADVTGIFNGVSGTFAFVNKFGLFKKEYNGTIWKPVVLPAKVRFVTDLIEDENHSLYLASSDGLFVSPDQGNTWEWVYTYGHVFDIDKKGELLLVSVVNGVLASVDGCKSWKKHNLTTLDPLLLADNDDLFRLSTISGYPTALRLDGPQKTGINGKIKFSADQGKTWMPHISDQYLKNIAEVMFMVEHDGKLYCSYQEGILVSTDGGISWEKIMHKDKKTPPLSISVIGNFLYCWEGVAGC